MAKITFNFETKIITIYDDFYKGVELYDKKCVSYRKVVIKNGQIVEGKLVRGFGSPKHICNLDYAYYFRQMEIELISALKEKHKSKELSYEELTSCYDTFCKLAKIDEVLTEPKLTDKCEFYIKRTNGVFKAVHFPEPNSETISFMTSHNDYRVFHNKARIKINNIALVEIRSNLSNNVFFNIKIGGCYAEIPVSQNIDAIITKLNELTKIDIISFMIPHYEKELTELKANIEYAKEALRTAEFHGFGAIDKSALRYEKEAEEAKASIINYTDKYKRYKNNLDELKSNFEKLKI